MPTAGLGFDTLLFDVLSDLSFGFVTDLKTGLVAAVLLGFLAWGSSILIEFLHSMAASSTFKRAQQYLGLMRSDEEVYGKDSAEYDYHSRVYQAYMSSAVKNSFTGRKAAFEPDIMYTGGDIADSSEDSQGYVFDETVFNYGEFSGCGDVDVGNKKISTTSGFIGHSSSNSTGSSSHSSSFRYSDDPGPSDADRPHFDDEDY